VSTRRILSCILLPAYVASCTSWHIEPVSPAQVVIQDQPSTIRVTLNDSTRFVLDSPVVSGDTVLGLAKSGSNTQRAVLLADISRVETRGRKVGLGQEYWANCGHPFGPRRGPGHPHAHRMQGPPLRGFVEPSLSGSVGQPASVINRDGPDSGHDQRRIPVSGTVVSPRPASDCGLRSQRPRGTGDPPQGHPGCGGRN
jgi:hypothetical protein